MFVVKEFGTERGATKFARGFDEARKLFGLPSLEVRGDAQTGGWAVVDTVRNADGKWFASIMPESYAPDGMSTLKPDGSGGRLG